MNASSSPSLSPLLPILNAFNHRHHNQHRLTHWWPLFRSLRRTIRNLVDDASPSRAIWLNKHLIPRAYLAFSQLAADNQHAPLGLLLLAILARVHAALAIDSPVPKAQPQPKANHLANQDKGVAISRQELPLSTSTERIKLSTTQDISEPSHQQAVAAKPSKKLKETSKKKKKGKGDALSSLFGSLA
ncbi:hypothetical protein ACQKWADRAFT_304363 [Trichoderma austrokoningii]